MFFGWAPGSTIKHPLRKPVIFHDGSVLLKNNIGSSFSDFSLEIYSERGRNVHAGDHIEQCPVAPRTRAAGPHSNVCIFMAKPGVRFLKTISKKPRHYCSESRTCVFGGIGSVRKVHPTHTKALWTANLFSVIFGASVFILGPLRLVS